MKSEVFFIFFWLAEEQAASQQVNRGIDKHSIHMTFAIWTSLPAAHTAATTPFTPGLAKYFAALTTDGASVCNSPFFKHATAKAVKCNEIFALTHHKRKGVLTAFIWDDDSVSVSVISWGMNYWLNCPCCEVGTTKFVLRHINLLGQEWIPNFVCVMGNNMRAILGGNI